MLGRVTLMVPGPDELMISVVESLLLQPHLQFSIKMWHFMSLPNLGASKYTLLQFVPESKY